MRIDDPTTWPAVLRVDREVAGWCTGLLVLLAVALPLTFFATFALWEFRGYAMVDDGQARPDPVGGVLWLGACGLLLTLPVAAGLIAGRTFARPGRRILAVAGPLNAALFLWLFLG